MQPKALIEFYEKNNIADDARARLQIYHDLLLKWQKAINLVSPSTIKEAWTRHFLDSAQIIRLISPETEVIADLGSGAGFPGLVTAILRPDLKIHLVESDERKAQFLRTVSRETGIIVSIHAERIEKITEEISPDTITARALASLPELLKYAGPWIDANPDITMLCLKGEKAEEEVRVAKNSWHFDEEIYPSITESKAQILRIKNIQPLK